MQAVEHQHRQQRLWAFPSGSPGGYMALTVEAIKADPEP